MEPGRGDALHLIGGPRGMKVMGLQDRAQQAPAIRVGKRGSGRYWERLNCVGHNKAGSQRWSLDRSQRRGWPAGLSPFLHVLIDQLQSVQLGL
jgi:hypothetical protein